jgi:hypothetical protein
VCRQFIKVWCDTWLHVNVTHHVPAGEYSAHPVSAIMMPAVAAAELEDPRNMALKARVMYLVQLPRTSNCAYDRKKHQIVMYIQKKGSTSVQSLVLLRCVLCRRDLCSCRDINLLFCSVSRHMRKNFLRVIPSTVSMCYGHLLVCLNMLRCTCMYAQ